MVFKKETMKIIGTFIAIILFLVGASLMGYAVSNWFMFLLSLMVALALIFEVGIKKFTNMSNLKNLGTQQYLTLSIAGVILISAFGSLFGFAVPIIDTVSSFAIMLGGVLFLIETWTNN